ncbi:NADP-dependent 3-hydroxy acid dehydrogenase YdfG [Prosthecobacter fusiformis]|uniref:NADP-dependent 3-hydroxy acid dehydrogenase YdfG n=1 Tax=Prosthecobacter fusiformis TaxID=48464 RepID=A0A4V3FFL4_9BACT|nr:SDR family oxidoreductase [Prosthecobacter fusiformis]TDU71233.1 NADP-dependent 3-hydroxy acid dehydrogenase YdfG [Prosthecobacter fusiformis]
MNNRTVIVTGGSRGYGAGIAEAFIKAGASVWITGRNEQVLNATAQRIGAHAFVADVADGAAWDRLMETVMKETGRLDVLVNNAGEGVKIGPVSALQDAHLVQSIASNLTGAMLGCARAAGIMQRQGSGLIVNIGSACSKHAWPGWSVYSAAKAGLLMFSKCLLTELRPHGIRVTSVLPSWGQTDFTDAAGLPPRDADILSRCISPADLGHVLVGLAEAPAHLVTEELTLWPMVQPMTQL